MNPNWSARVVSMEMMMTCRGGLSDGHEQAARVEARTRIVQAVVQVRGMDDPESVASRILLWAGARSIAPTPADDRGFK